MFDQVAKTYDETFSYSFIGKKLRSVVWSYLDSVVKHNSQLDILEVNCGTGEDAIEFGKRGHNVMASDLSNDMVEIAKEKAIAANLNNISCFTSDMRNIKGKPESQKYDLIFSNFGGLNCIAPNELSTLASNFAEMLKPNGRLIGVIMPKYCLWEIFYFVKKGKWKEGFRRNTNKSLAVRVGNEMVDTWYYSPSEFQKYFGDKFNKISIRPVGITLPPSYLENYFNANPGKLEKLDKWEQNLGQIAGLSFLSDHFLIDLIKKN